VVKNVVIVESVIISWYAVRRIGIIRIKGFEPILAKPTSGLCLCKDANQK